MIAKETFTTYAQYNEDIILAALLFKVKNGFYVDVGANHEEYHSVTKYFYERGWTGINIEPNKKLISEFELKRKRDINLAIGVSNNKGLMQLREYPVEDGFSTLSEVTKKELSSQGLQYIDYEIEVKTLADIFGSYQINQINFLKIDVEGFEQEVIEGNNWHKYRPQIVCIEASHRKKDWTKIFEQNGYIKFIFDGLNEYYIEKGSMAIAEGFDKRVTLLAHNGLRNHHTQLWQHDDSEISRLRAFSKEQDSYIKGLKHENEVLKTDTARLDALTFTGKPLKNRISLFLKSFRKN